MKQVYELASGDIAMSLQVYRDHIRAAVDAGKRIGYQNGLEKAIVIATEASQMLDNADISLRSVFDLSTHTNTPRQRETAGGLLHNNTPESNPA
jgi:hypothetical protein